MLTKSVELILCSLLLLVVAACGPAGTLPAPSPEEPTALPAYDARPLPTERGSLFAGSGLCASCHTEMADRAGNDVSIDTAWRASMMANASRDPYWQAAVRAETLDLPSLRSVIEDKCASCHTPMDHFAAVLGQGFLDPDHPRQAFAADGVSCTLCHQIEQQGLGDPDSFSGGFSIDTQRPAGQRVIYGPYFAPPRAPRASCRMSPATAPSRAPTPSVRSTALPVGGPCPGVTSQGGTVTFSRRRTGSSPHFPPERCRDFCCLMTSSA